MLDDCLDLEKRRRERNVKRNISLAGLLLLAACGTDRRLGCRLCRFGHKSQWWGSEHRPQRRYLRGLQRQRGRDDTRWEHHAFRRRRRWNVHAGRFDMHERRWRQSVGAVQSRGTGERNGFTLTLGKDLKAASGEETLGVDITKRFATVSSE